MFFLPIIHDLMAFEILKEYFIFIAFNIVKFKEKRLRKILPAIASMKRPIENEHEDENYQLCRSKIRKTATQATSVVPEHCIVDKIEDLLDKTLFSINKIQTNGEEF